MHVSFTPAKLSQPVELEPAKVTVEMTSAEAGLLATMLFYTGGTAGGPFAWSLYKALERVGVTPTHQPVTRKTTDGLVIGW